MGGADAQRRGHRLGVVGFCRLGCFIVLSVKKGSEIIFSFLFFSGARFFIFLLYNIFLRCKFFQSISVSLGTLSKSKLGLKICGLVDHIFVDMCCFAPMIVALVMRHNPIVFPAAKKNFAQGPPLVLTHSKASHVFHPKPLICWCFTFKHPL